MPICDECGQRRQENNGRFFQRESGRIGGAVNGSYSWGGSSKSSRKRMGYSGGRKLFKQYFVCFECNPLPTQAQIKAQEKQDAIDKYYRKLFYTICFLVVQIAWVLNDYISWRASWRDSYWIHLLVLAFIFPLSNPTKKPKVNVSSNIQDGISKISEIDTENDLKADRQSSTTQPLLDSDADEYDPLYDEALEIVLTTGRASIPGIQRQLRIGYNRAARLIEAMERNGVISSMNDNGSRDVLVTK